MTMFTKARDQALVVEIADYFDTLASDSQAFAKRGIGSRREHERRAQQWKEAADDVRSIRVMIDADAERVRDAAADLLAALEACLASLDAGSLYEPQAYAARAAIARARGAS